jgi:hypothetical protein
MVGLCVPEKEDVYPAPVKLTTEVLATPPVGMTIALVPELPNANVVFPLELNNLHVIM